MSGDAGVGFAWAFPMSNRVVQPPAPTTEPVRLRIFLCDPSPARCVDYSTSGVTADSSQTITGTSIQSSSTGTLTMAFKRALNNGGAQASGPERPDAALTS